MVSLVFLFIFLEKQTFTIFYLFLVSRCMALNYKNKQTIDLKIKMNY